MGGGLTILEHWLFPDSSSLLATRTSGEWQPVDSQMFARRDFIESLNRVLRAIDVRVDVLAERLEVYLDAEDAVWSSMIPASGSIRSPAWQGPQSRGGPPILSATFDEIRSGYGLLCDPDARVDGPDEDVVADNDCPLAVAARALGHELGPCPLQGNCDPLADLASEMEELRASLRTLRFRLEWARAGWDGHPAGDGGADPPPVLHIRFRVGVEMEPEFAGIVPAYLVDLMERYGAATFRWTLFEGSVLLPLGVDEAFCPAMGEPDPDRGPGIRWIGFQPAPGSTMPDVDVEWVTRNLVLGEPVEPWENYQATRTDTEFGISDLLAYLMAYWYGEEAVLETLERLEATEDQTRAAVVRISESVGQAVHGYLNLVPSGPGVGEVRNEPLRAAMSLCDAPDGGDPGAARAFAMRMIEGSAGASRAWWNAMTDPLALVERYVGVTGFEYTATTWSLDASGTGTRRPLFEVTIDSDCDGVADHLDRCPTWPSAVSELDRDHDLLGDTCDLCPFAARLDDGLPRRSPEYIVTPGRYAPRVGDSDGDEVGDRCDLCPTMRWFDDADPHDPLTREMEGPAALDWEGAPPTDYLGSAHDGDGDGIGNRCDNCPIVANRDQWNCNAAWERVHPTAAPLLLATPTPWRVGVGDACDSDWPCVDSCVAPEREPTLHVERMEGDERYWTPPHQPTASVDVCPTWRNRAGGGTSTLGPAVDTLVQRCHCSESERADGTCLWVLCPLSVPPGSGRWDDADYDDAPRDTSGEVLPTPYQYQELYHGDPDLGLLGTRGSILGYAAYWAAGRPTRQEWNWHHDLCVEEHLSPCRADAQMWFRPLPTVGTGFFGRAYDRAYGNTYTRWTQLDGEGIANTLPAGTMHPPFRAGGGGATGVTIPWVMDDTGRLGRNTNALIDILRVRCFAEWGPCPGWPDWLFFETPGDEVAGVTVSSWSAASNDLGWTLGTKPTSPAVFDLIDPAAAFAFDGKGDPYRFWSFGGSDASGRASDQMWVAALTVRDAWGFEHPVEAAGLPVELTADGRPDPERTFFALSPVARGNLWPPARQGAVLVCTGAGSSVAAGCDGQCPRPAVALGLEPPPDGDREPAGSLLLVGGEGDAGPRSDIWLYEERATWIPPSDVTPGDDGPWVSGWRQLGELPDVAGGLAEPGVTQVGRTLWLVGGRTAAGPTSDLFRIDLDSGTATRIAGSGGASGRVAPAVAYDPARGRLVVFGGSDASNRAVADLWYVDPLTGGWSLAAAPCAGDGCPGAAGRTALSVNRPTSEVTVVADRGVSTPATSAWTLRAGVWESLGERRGDVAVADCDGDGAADALHGARCAIGSTAGFPEFGRLRCAGVGLTCRAPAAPAVVVSERTMRDLAAVATQGGEVFAVRGTQVEVFRIGPTGEIVPARTLRLRSAAHDLAAAPGALLAAHPQGVSLYDIAGGSLLATIDTCGKPRRVFVAGRRAYIVGLLSVAVADISEPAAPVVLDRFRLLPAPEGLALHSCSDCGWFDRGVDRLCDGLGGCGVFGRGTAAYDRGLLFLHLFGVLHVLDVRHGSGPAVLASVPVGLARELRVEGDFVYVLRPFREGLAVRRGRSGEWSVAGPHDVGGWVDAALDVGPWTLHWAPGRLQVATRQ